MYLHMYVFMYVAMHVYYRFNLVESFGSIPLMAIIYFDDTL